LKSQTGGGGWVERYGRNDKITNGGICVGECGACVWSGVAGGPEPIFDEAPARYVPTTGVLQTMHWTVWTQALIASSSHTYGLPAGQDYLVRHTHFLWAYTK
jgi:hypothetical protein